VGWSKTNLSHCENVSSCSCLPILTPVEIAAGNYIPALVFLFIP
jgi:hypothetical protein